MNKIKIMHSEELFPYYDNDLFKVELFLLKVLGYTVWRNRFMQKIRSFLFAGGDVRQLYAADKLKKMGYETAASGFEKYDGAVAYKAESVEKAYLYDAVVLPLPLTRDGENINAPFSESKISIKSLSEFLGKGKSVFGGKMSGDIAKLFYGNKIYDCYSREDFQLLNALPTAEGIAEIALRELPITVNGAEILVLGFGRTGKAIGKLLKVMGADVIIGARKTAVLAEAEDEGFKTLNILADFDIPLKIRMAVNTVPAQILSEKHLKQLKGCLYAEAASAPYGTDLEKARGAGVNTVLASGLPGKIAPESAGEIIAETIINTIKEDS